MRGKVDPQHHLLVASGCCTQRVINVREQLDTSQSDFRGIKVHHASNGVNELYLKYESMSVAAPTICRTLKGSKY